MEVTYPVEVKQYQVSVKSKQAVITLEGVETPLPGADTSTRDRRVGLFWFNLDDTDDREDFINRGGFLDMRRSVELLSCILDLLRNEEPLYLHGNGTLSTSLEPVGEDEDQ